MRSVDKLFAGATLPPLVHPLGIFLWNLFNECRLDKKYHVQHFTCSCCSTLFGPQDSYYEHQNAQGIDVYCHYHYSTRCAQKVRFIYRNIVRYSHSFIIVCKLSNCHSTAIRRSQPKLTRRSISSALSPDTEILVCKIRKFHV